MLGSTSSVTTFTCERGTTLAVLIASFFLSSFLFRAKRRDFLRRPVLSSTVSEANQIVLYRSSYTGMPSQRMSSKDTHRTQSVGFLAQSWHISICLSSLVHHNSFHMTIFDRLAKTCEYGCTRNILEWRQGHHHCDRRLSPRNIDDSIAVRWAY